MHDRRQFDSPHRRAGSITVELMLNLPIWLMMIFAVVEFGELVSSAQHVLFAARVGAREASRSDSLPDEGAVPYNILQAVASQLGSAGIGNARVILEHNLGGKPVVLVSGRGHTRPPRAAPPQLGKYVRVTVFARVDDLAPNLLETFGIDLSSNLLAQSATFRHEGRVKEKL